MQPSPHSETAAKIKKLAALSLNELRSTWVSLFSEPPPKLARSDYLIRAIAFHIQETASGAPPKSSARRLQKLVNGTASETVSQPHALNKLRPGARLLREWQSETHEVLVITGGFQYRGKVFKSLSQIARLITDTRWSGPLFFGLKRTPVKNNNGAARAAPTYVVDLGSPAGPAKITPATNRSGAEAWNGL